MREQFSPPKNVESAEGHLFEQLEKNAENIEVAIATWSENLDLLKESFPHDDILQDTSYPYDVAHCLFLSRLNALLDAKKENEELQKELKSLS